MSTPRRQQRTDADVVVEAALGLFEQRGYKGTSVDDIASHAGVGKSRLYLLFRKKEDILVASVDPALVALARVLSDTDACVGSAGARVECMLRRTIEVELAHVAAIRVLLALRGNSDLQRRLLGRRRAFERQMTHLVREAITAGEFRAEADPRLTTQLLLSLADWLAAWYRPDGVMTPEELARAVATFALDGLRRR